MFPIKHNDVWKMYKKQIDSFWRVEEIDRPKLLRLRAEMKMPGLAWLEFGLETDDETGGTVLTQVAIYAPKGLLGHAYWWAVWPMHGLVFPSMARIAAFGSKKSQPKK
jgi:hypothetical protein